MNESYSQIGEDRIVDFYLGSKATGVYVDIGAHDPVQYSNTYLFYCRGWKGLLVEPNPRKASQLRVIRPADTVVCAACGLDSEVTLHEMDADSLTTKVLQDSYVGHGFKVVSTIKAVCFPLSQYLANFAHVDFLSIDVEGMEMDVIHSNNWWAARPTIVCIETRDYKGPHRPEIDDFMKSFDYEILGNTWLNTIYCVSELPR